MNSYYGWSEDGFYFYCEGYAYTVDTKGATFRHGKTEDVIKEHPPEKGTKRMYLRRK